MAVEERETTTEEEAAPALSVSAAMGLAKNALEEVVVRLVGEVSEVNDKPGYKAVYFTVKDEKASLPCMMWMNRYQASGVALSVGALVELTGRFSLYAAKGRMNFDVFSVSLAGEGQLRLQVANLARELEAMGLMDPARKRPLPRLSRGHRARHLAARRRRPRRAANPAQALSSGPHPVRRRSRGGPRGGRRARGRSGQGGLCRR